MNIFDLQNYPKVKIMLAVLFAENTVIARNNELCQKLCKHIKAYPRMWAACGTVKSVTSGLPLSRSQPHVSEAKNFQ